MGKDLDGQFSKEDAQLVNKHILSGGNICHSKMYLLDMRINSGWLFFLTLKTLLFYYLGTNKNIFSFVHIHKK